MNPNCPACSADTDACACTVTPTERAEPQLIGFAAAPGTPAWIDVQDAIDRAIECALDDTVPDTHRAADVETVRRWIQAPRGTSSVRAVDQDPWRLNSGSARVLPGLEAAIDRVRQRWLKRPWLTSNGSACACVWGTQYEMGPSAVRAAPPGDGGAG